MLPLRLPAAACVAALSSGCAGIGCCVSVAEATPEGGERILVIGAAIIEVARPGAGVTAVSATSLGLTAWSGAEAGASLGYAKRDSLSVPADADVIVERTGPGPSGLRVAAADKSGEGRTPP